LGAALLGFLEPPLEEARDLADGQPGGSATGRAM